MCLTGSLPQCLMKQVMKTMTPILSRQQITKRLSKGANRLDLACQLIAEINLNRWKGNRRGVPLVLEDHNREPDSVQADVIPQGLPATLAQSPAQEVTTGSESHDQLNQPSDQLESVLGDATTPA